MPALAGFVEKSTKYTKSWAKRYFTFDAETCKLEYGESQTKVKASLTLSKIVRASEVNAKVNGMSPDLYSFTIEGTLADGKQEAFGMRCPDKTSFNEWFFSIRNALGSKGSMDPFNYGLPPKDPRTNLDLVSVPVEHLYRFHLLDRAIMYLFAEVDVYSSVGGTEVTKELLVIGDRCAYLFKHTADVHRCIPITSISKVYAGTGVVGIVMTPPQHDLMLINCLIVSEIAHVLSQVMQAIPNTSDVEVDTTLVTQADIESKLHLTQRDGYKHVVTPPTPKMKLKAAMDVYEKSTGQPFVYGSASKPAAALPKQAAHQAPADVDINDPMAAALMKVGMTQYIVMLQRQHVDLDLLAVMEPDDLVNFGIDNPQHRRVISAVCRGEPVETAAPASPPPQQQPKVSSGQASPPPQQQKRVVTLSDSDDDLPPPVIAAKRVITLSSDDDDELTLPPPRAINLSDDDDDLPLPQRGAVPAIAADDDI